MQGMQLGVDGVFVTFLVFLGIDRGRSLEAQAFNSRYVPYEVGSGIFKSEDPAKRARAIVKACLPQSLDSINS